MKTTAITTQQLADLADLSPSFFTLHRDDLPQAFDVPSASPKGGRPAKGYDLEQLADFILTKTSFLTDVECRLRVALMPGIRDQENVAMRVNARLIDDDAGRHFVFEQLDDLPPELRVKAQAMLDAELAALRTRRCANRQPHRTPSEGSQP